MTMEEYNKLPRDSQGRTRLYRIWADMKIRCTKPSKHNFDRYGGRGIKICSEWLYNWPIFMQWALTHGYRDDLELDRIDNDGDYTPENCRFVTKKEQARNRSNNVRIHIGDTIRCLAEWLEIFDLNKGTYYSRRSRGWTIEESLLRPVQRV